MISEQDNKMIFQNQEWQKLSGLKIAVPIWLGLFPRAQVNCSGSTPQLNCFLYVEGYTVVFLKQEQ